MNLPKCIFRLLLGRRLPIVSGELRVSGIEQPVTIRRDRYHIPYIEAKGERDAWYGLGFCHGQDRAFQLETFQRIVRGTLAELVGPSALPLDRLSRRIGFRYAAEGQLATLDPETRSYVEAYARGVTEGMMLGCRRQAHEFALLRASPTPYCAADTLGVLQIISFSLASNWDCELARLKILTTDGPEALVALDPAYPEWLPVTSPPGAVAGEAVDRLAEDLALFRTATGLNGGSNNWAIAPSRTASGRAILANDPHLGPSLPNPFYLAHLRTPDWALSGASFFGTPTFPVGHNGTAAWGVTNGLVDNTDLFIEEIGPDGRSVREVDGYLPCETRLESIQVKGGEVVEELVLITPRGPIVGPALAGEVGAISLRATWLEPRPVNGLFRSHHARSFESFRRSFEQWPSLSLNMVYADTSGAVGWQLVGEAPRRRVGWGTIPLPGWLPEIGWEDAPLSFEHMPHLADPECGYLATANNQPTPAGEPHYLSADWVDGYRQARIIEALEAREDWDLPAVSALQMDQASIPWREVSDILLAVPGDDDEVREALSMLEAWDGQVSADSPAAAVFQFFLAEIDRRIIQAKAPRAAEWVLGRGFAPLFPNSMLSMRRVGCVVRLLRSKPDSWFERSWGEEMAAALRAVILTLRARYGADHDRWAWGYVRPLTLRHTVGERAPLDRVFNLGPFPWGGDTNTIAQASANPADPTANPLAIASLRMALELGNWDESRFVLAGGQSGNPLSPHYADMLPLWQRGEGVPIAWSAEKVEAATHSILYLAPLSASKSEMFEGG